MNENANYVTSFQQFLPPPFATPGRRHRIANAVEVEEEALAGFNGLIGSLGWQRAPLTADQLATAARAAAPRPGTSSRYIDLQLDRGRDLSRMLDERDWEPANDAASAARSVVAYLQREDGLIPNWVPGVGQLDDALVVETAWPRVAAEVLDFQDFCRIRGIEALMRGEEAGSFAFGRSQWLEARRAEALLRAQQRVLRGRFRSEASLPQFRVH